MSKGTLCFALLRDTGSICGCFINWIGPKSQLQLEVSISGMDLASTAIEVALVLEIETMIKIILVCANTSYQQQKIHEFSKNVL